MLSRSVTVALLWMLASGPLAPAGARLPTAVEDAIQHVTADELRSLFQTAGLHPDDDPPDDDTERIDFPKLERITELAGRLAWMAADGEAPRFKASHRGCPTSRRDDRHDG